MQAPKTLTTDTKLSCRPKGKKPMYLSLPTPWKKSKHEAEIASGENCGGEARKPARHTLPESPPQARSRRRFQLWLGVLSVQQTLTHTQSEVEGQKVGKHVYLEQKVAVSTHTGPLA